MYERMRTIILEIPENQLGIIAKALHTYNRDSASSAESKIIEEALKNLNEQTRNVFTRPEQHGVRESADMDKLVFGEGFAPYVPMILEDE